MEEKTIVLSLPADADYTLLARLVISGLGMISGLDVDQVDDLRTVASECCDCLLHQRLLLNTLNIHAVLNDDRLRCCFSGTRSDKPTGVEPPDLTITRGVLETLLPDVALQSDEDGVYQISFAIAVPVTEAV